MRIANPFAISEVPDVDWVAHVKRELTPVRAGRFFVHGSHDVDQIPEGVEALWIEAAMAFGTGHHNTTKGCLEALDQMPTVQALVSIEPVSDERVRTLDEHSRPQLDEATLAALDQRLVERFCQLGTQDLASITRTADILVELGAALG